MQIPRKEQPNPNSDFWRDLAGQLHVLVDAETGVWLNLVHGHRVLKPRKHTTLTAKERRERATTRQQRRAERGKQRDGTH